MKRLAARFSGTQGRFAFDVDFSAPAHGVTALFGPSGCGKTTVLRCIAGLARPASGHLELGDECWHDTQHFVPAHRRPIGYVFQEASLFAHLSVRGNLDYACKRSSGVPNALRFDDLVGSLGLSALLDRMPSRLSGGERQRVAIARALLTRPRLLLMDEPLSALDGAARDDILGLLEGLAEICPAPIIYVSHAIDEVARLADHLVLLDAGRVRAAGATNALLTRADLPLAHSEHAGAVFHGRVTGTRDDVHLTEIDSDGGTLLVSTTGRATGSAVRLRIAARDVSIALTPPIDSSIVNHFPVTVIDITPDPHPGHRLLRLAARDTVLLARITEHSRSRLALAPGMAVWALIKAVAVR